MAVVFGQTGTHDFVDHDDGEYVYSNPHVRQGPTGHAIAWATTAFYSCNWHPLTWLSHALDCGLYGLRPGGHHLSSVLLHAATVIFIFLAFRRTTAATWPSACVALIFAIHPLRVESVAWVAERKDVLSGLFFAATLWFYAAFAERPTSWGRYLCVLVAFAFGLMAKPMLVTAPFVLLLLDYWPLRRWGRAEAIEQGTGGPRGPGRVSSFAPRKQPHFCGAKGDLLPSRLICEKLPMFAMAAASCGVTLAAQHRALRSLEELPFSRRLAEAIVAYAGYLGKMVVPVDLAVVYPLAKDPPSTWKIVASAAVLLGVSTVAVLLRRRCPYLLFGWLWYLGALVPVIGLVQVGPQAMADRYTYLTQIGLYVAIVWGVAEFVGADTASTGLRAGFLRAAAAACEALLLAALMVRAWQQTAVWRNSETLWTHALACTARNPAAHLGLGSVLAGRGQLVEALDQYERALRITPKYADAQVNLGAALARLGRLHEAIAHYRMALKIEPENAVAYNNLALAQAGLGEEGAAIAGFHKALEIRPDYAEAHSNLGAVLVRHGALDEAVDHYQKALEIQSDYAEAHVNLAAVLARLGQRDKAMEHCRTALESRPELTEGHVVLGDLLGSQAPAEALAHYRTALGLAAEANHRDLMEVIARKIRKLKSP